MNREYNDNKMYNSALDELRFSEEAKSRMVDRLTVSYTHLTLPTICSV